MGRVKISKRLTAVAGMVTKGNSVADIGCDHAYTSIYLVQNDISNRVIAMDVNKGPLERVAEHVKEYNCEDFIDIRLSDGAKNLNKGEVDTLMIAGMGGRLMYKILSDSEEVVRECKELVLQPQSEIFLVRRYLRELGFRIILEDMLIDEDKYYVIIKAVNEYDRYTCIVDDKQEVYDRYTCIADDNQEVYDLYGEHLLKNKNEILFEFLQKEMETCSDILNNLEKKIDGSGDAIVQRVEELKVKSEYIRKGLEFYEVQ